MSAAGLALVADEPRSHWAVLLGAAMLGAAIAGAAGLALPALRPHVLRVRRSWAGRVAVAGHSMAPALLPGDWLLVDPAAFVGRPPAPGDLVVAADPREPGRWIVKRVREVLHDGRLQLAGDHPAHAADWAALGPVDPAAVAGRPWLRYWPLGRLGRIG